MAKITAEVMDLTPQMAEEWLGANLESQRLIQQVTVEKYKYAMLNGLWQKTGESIILDDSGKLLNGQHRLKAVVEAKYTIKDQVVVRGVPQEAFRAMDTGRRRQAYDVLTIAGHGGSGEQRYVKTLGAVASIAHLYKLGYNPIAAGSSRDSFKRDGTVRTSMVTHMDILKFVENNGTVKSSTKLVMDVQGFTRLMMPSSYLAWAHYQGRKLDAALADEYVHAMITGANLKPGDPFRILRELLLQEKMSNRRHLKLDVIAAVVKTWNAKRNDEKLKPGEVFERDWEKFPRFV